MGFVLESKVGGAGRRVLRFERWSTVLLSHINIDRIILISFILIFLCSLFELQIRKWPSRFSYDINFLQSCIFIVYFRKYIWTRLS
jgi:hypothetical protein